MDADRESYPHQTPQPDGSSVYIPIIINPDAADDNCGDANKLADGTADNDTPFFLVTSMPEAEVVGRIASEHTDSDYQTEGQIQTLLDIQIDSRYLFLYVERSY